MSDAGDTPGTPSLGRATLADIDALAHRVADAVLAVPGVVGLHPGQFGDVATYLPGRRVSGVRVLDDHSEVHVVVAEGMPVLAVADAVRSTVVALTGKPVDVTVADIAPATPDAQPSDAPSPKEFTS